MSGLREFWRELRRRKVLQTTGIYLVLTYVAVDLAEVYTALYGVERWITVAIAGGALFFLPFMVVLAWMFEVTGDGVRLVRIMPDPDAEPEYGARRLEIVFLLLLVAALGWTFFRMAYLTPPEPDEDTAAMITGTVQRNS